MTIVLPITSAKTLKLVQKEIKFIKQKIKLAEGNEALLDSLKNELASLVNQLDTFTKEQGSKITTSSKQNVWDYIMKSVRKVTGDTTAGDAAAAVTKVVLIGNVLKEAVGTVLYTVQAATNEDLDKDKRMFIAAYDGSVGLVSTLVSLCLGVGFQDLIEHMCKKGMFGAKASPKYKALVASLAATTSFMLQTIIGKRIIAPRIGVPLAGKIRESLEQRNAKKNGAVANNANNDNNSNQVKDLNATQNNTFIDAKTYAENMMKKSA